MLYAIIKQSQKLYFSKSVKNGRFSVVFYNDCHWDYIDFFNRCPWALLAFVTIVTGGY